MSNPFRQLLPDKGLQTKHETRISRPCVLLVGKNGTASAAARNERQLSAHSLFVLTRGLYGVPALPRHFLVMHSPYPPVAGLRVSVVMRSPAAYPLLTHVTPSHAHVRLASPRLRGARRRRTMIHMTPTCRQRLCSSPPRRLDPRKPLIGPGPRLRRLLCPRRGTTPLSLVAHPGSEAMPCFGRNARLGWPRLISGRWLFYLTVDIIVLCCPSLIH